MHYDMGYQTAKKLVENRQSEWESDGHTGLTVYTQDNAVVKF
jgi:hypothetical protein